MTTSPDNPNSRTEQMLRQWGAARAAAEAPVGPMPKPDQIGDGISVAEGAALLDAPPRGADEDRPNRLPWVLVAATAAAAAVAIAIGYAATSSRTEQIDRLQTQLVDARRDLAGANDRIDELTAKTLALSDGARRGRQQLLVLQAQLKQVQTQSRELSSQLRQSEALAQQRARDAENTREQLAALLQTKEQQMQSLVRMIDARRANLTEQEAAIDKQRAEARRWIASGKQATAEAEQLRSLNRNLVQAAQQAYLSARSGQTQGIVARQSAARKANMTARARKVQQLATQDDLRRLVEKLEVIFTRLDMLDPARQQSVQQFQSMVQSANVLADLNAALASGIDNVTVRTWLFEARMILA